MHSLHLSSLQHCPSPMDGWDALALLRTLSDKRWALKELIRGWKEKADSTVWNWVRRLPFKTRCLPSLVIMAKGHLQIQKYPLLPSSLP